MIFLVMKINRFLLQFRIIEMIIPKNWNAFLQVDENKIQLFQLIAKDIVEIPSSQCMIVTTYGENVLTLNSYDCSKMSPCNHEEADSRLFVHVKDAVYAGHKKIVVRTVDSDVVVLAVAFFAEIKELQQLWVAVGTKTSYR